MGKRVTVLPGFEAVSLPTGPDGEDQGYHAGETVVIADEWYPRLNPATRRGLSMPEEAPDPEPVA